MNQLYGNDHAADDTHFNKTTGKFEDAKGNSVKPHEYLKKQKTVKDGLGNSVRDYVYNPAENKFEHKDDLVHESPLPVGMPRELKFGSAAHRRKYPSQYKTINELEDLKKFQNGTYIEPTVGTAAHRKKYPARYGHNYTSKLDQVAYPKLGTAPSEKEIRKKLDNVRGVSTWDLIKQTAKTPSEKREVRQIINEQYEKNPQSLSKDEWKYVDRDKIKPVKIFSNDDPNSFPSNETQRRALLTPEKFTKPPQYPEIKLAALPERDPNQEAREAALEKTREYAFSKIPDPDAVKGIGSFRNTIGRKLRASNSRTDWEKSNQRTYEDNSDAKK